MQAGIGPVADRGHLRGSGDLGTPRDRSPLWAKFPNQLGGREPIVRRTDLGAKGIYYRTMVGPFASMENAAGMCRTLKAASGNCPFNEIESTLDHRSGDCRCSSSKLLIPPR